MSFFLVNVELLVIASIHFMCRVSMQTVKTLVDLSYVKHFEQSESHKRLEIKNVTKLPIMNNLKRRSIYNVKKENRS